MANNGPTYTRLGPGDLPGDPNHPNSPDYVEPALGMDEAIASVAESLSEDEVSAILSDVIEAADALRWIASNVTIPVWWPTPHLHPFRALLLRAEMLEKLAEAEQDAQEYDDA